MFKEKYINELDSFALSKDFKAETIALLQQKQQKYVCPNTVVPSKRSVFRPVFKKTAIAFACAALVLLSVQTIRFYRGTSMSAGSEMQSFTINDVQSLDDGTKAGTSPCFFIKADYDSGSGFGYEGILLKDISQYDNGNPFSIHDSFDSLPVYRFNPPDIEQAEKETHQLLNALVADSSTAKTKITLTEIVYQDGHVSTHRDTVVSAEEFTRIKLKEPIVPHIYETVFDGGSIQMWLPRGETRITADVDALPGGTQPAEYIAQNYSAALGYDNGIVCTDTDYNIYGEENPTYYIYNHSEDYAQNLFNYSVNNARVYYSPREESLEEYDQFILWAKSDCYTRGEELPAINWQQALGLLYEGDYYSSVPYDITEETVVSRIELVYKPAPYNSMTLTSSSLSVPFYKFYVNIEEMDIKEKGLEDYGIYYVCAIDPAYIEITDNYAQFN